MPVLIISTHVHNLLLSWLGCDSSVYSRSVNLSKRVAVMKYKYSNVPNYNSRYFGKYTYFHQLPNSGHHAIIACFLTCCRIWSKHVSEDG